jgi:hypothetical protein
MDGTNNGFWAPIYRPYGTLDGMNAIEPKSMSRRDNIAVEDEAGVLLGGDTKI